MGKRYPNTAIYRPGVVEHITAILQAWSHNVITKRAMIDKIQDRLEWLEEYDESDVSDRD